MADEKEPEAGEDPWAGLESEQLPDLTEGGGFSFEGSEAAADEPDEAPTVDFTAMPSADAGGKDDADDVETADADDADANEWLEEPEEGSPAPELSVFQSIEESVDESVEEDDFDSTNIPVANDSAVELGMGDSGISSPAAKLSESDAATPEESEFSDSEDPFAAAIAAELFETDSADESAIAAAAASEMFEPGAEENEESEDADANSGGMFSLPADDDSAESPLDDEGEKESEFDFVNSPDADSPDVEAEESEPFAFPVENGESTPFEDAVEAGAPMIAATIGQGGDSEPKAKGKKPPRPAPAKKKKPSMAGQMIGMVVGGAMSIPIVLAILWWGFGKDPMKVAPMVPDALGFIVPEKFRAGGQIAATTGVGGALSLDDVVRSGDGPAPDDTDVATTDPDLDLDSVIPEPLPVDPSDTDVAGSDPLPDSEGDDDDPLMAILNEDSSESAEPAPPTPAPEPEPLDIAGLEAAAEKALAALDAVKSVDDPSDPVLKSLLKECYISLASYAQELAMLERVAADAGRPLEAMPAPVASIHEAIGDRRDLLDSLAQYARSWLVFSKRSSDGIVAPATFLSAKPVGPNWRAEVSVGDRPLVVMMRTEPAAAPGETVLVTGLIVDKDVVWATEVRPAKAADPFDL